MNVLDGFNGFNVVHSFSRIKDVTINTTKVNKLIFVTFISFISIHGKSLVIRWSDHRKNSNFWGGDGQNCVKTPKNLGRRRKQQNGPPAATWAFSMYVLVFSYTKAWYIILYLDANNTDRSDSIRSFQFYIVNQSCDIFEYLYFDSRLFKS